MRRKVDRIVAEVVFRMLLHLYPRGFRRRHGHEMTRYALDRWSATEGAYARLHLAVSTVVDVVRTAVDERTGRSALVRGRRRVPVGHHHSNESRTSDMGRLGQDLSHAARRLARAPFFTMAAIAIVALGVGSTTTVFAVVDALLLRPPPYERPEEVVHVYQHSDDGQPSSTSFPAYRDMAERTDVFSSVGAWSPGTASWDRGADVREVSVAWATSGYLPTLGLAPARGRWFAAEHDRVGSEQTAVVGHALWKGTLGGDPGVLGRTLRLNGQPVTVIGVAPASLRGARGGVSSADVWLSISATPVGGGYRVANIERREDHWYDVVARLAPGVGLDGARAAMGDLARQLAADFPELNRGRAISVFPVDEVRFHPEADAPLRGAGAMLAVVAALVLILCVSNFGNLLLVRGLARSSEVAVRRALGASGGAVASLLLLESALLAAAGGIVGVIVARVTVGALPRLPVDLPITGMLDVAVDGRVLAFALILTGATGVVAGLIPALRGARGNVAGVLREETRGTSAGRLGPAVGRALVVAQVAASLVLAAGTGLVGRSLGRVARVDPGFDSALVAFVRADLASAGVSQEESGAVARQLIERVGALPGVEAVGLATRLPASPGGSSTTVVEGYVPPTGTGAVEVDFSIVSPGYRATLGIPLVEGRDFTEADDAGGEAVALVNEAAAGRFWPDGGAVGGRFRPQSSPDAWVRVVGVVGNTTVAALSETTPPLIYHPWYRYAPTSLSLVVRTDGDPVAVLPGVREAFREVRAGVPFLAQGGLETVLGDDLEGARIGVAALGLFTVVALFLSSLGVYAVVAFGVSRRTAEMGIRIALGSSRSRVVRLVVADVAGTVLAGVALGVAAVLAAAPALQGVLYDIGGRDPLTLSAAAGVLLAVAGVAAWIPARRAAGADPMEAFRAG